MRKRRKHPPAETKEQRIAELEEQLAQALLIIQRQQKQIERLQEIFCPQKPILLNFANKTRHHSYLVNFTFFAFRTPTLGY